MKTILKYPICTTIIFAVLALFTACSSKEDEPIPPAKPLPPTEKEYMSEITNYLWVMHEWYFVNSDGDKVPRPNGWEGDLAAIYIFQDGVVLFNIDSLSSTFYKTDYDPNSGVITSYNTGYPKDFFHIVDWSENWLTIDFPFYNKNEEEWPYALRFLLRKMRYPDMAYWVKNYSPNHYDPADFGWVK